MQPLPPRGRNAQGGLAWVSVSRWFDEPSRPLLPSSGTRGRTLILWLGGMVSSPSSHTGSPIQALGTSEVRSMDEPALRKH